MGHDLLEFDAEVCVDVREKALINEFRRHGAEGFKIQELPVGDVSCTYRSGHGWLIERKSCQDFVASICDGRYAEQRARLVSTPHQVVYVVEGELQVHRGEKNSKWHHILLSAIVSLNSEERVRVYRTIDVAETFNLIIILVRKLESQRGPMPSGLVPPKMASKRQRESSPSTSLVRMLCCVPSVSESIALRLVAELGGIQSIQQALEHVKMPRIDLGNGKCLGKQLWKHLRRHLLERPTVQK